jgi:hypothetical protein
MKPGDALPITRLFSNKRLTGDFNDPAVLCPVCGCQYPHPRVTTEHLSGDTDPQIRLTFRCETGHHASELQLRAHAGQVEYRLTYLGEESDSAR